MSKYSIEESSLVTMYDEIRNKTGLTDGLVPEQAAIDLAALSSLPRGIPSYVYEEAQRVAARVKAVQTAGSVTIIDISDMHLSVAANDTTSQTHACMAAYLLSVLCSVDFIAVHGDNTRGSASSDTLDTMLVDFLEANRLMAYFDPNARMYGNHELHPYRLNAVMVLKESAHKYLDRFAHGVIKDGSNRGYYYTDLDEFRVICLNTSDLFDMTEANFPVDQYQKGGVVGTAGIDGCFISATQLRWLCDILTSTPSDKKIVVLSHHPITWGKRYSAGNNMPTLLKVLSDYNNRQSSNGVNALTPANKTETITYDFSDCASTIWLNIHGHLHNMVARRDTDSGIWAVCTPNACLGRNNEIKNNDTSATAQEWFWDTDTPKLTKTANSYADTALTVSVIDPVKKTLHSICYGLGDGSGYGRDRTLALGGNYIVTFNLEKVSANNNVTSVLPNAAYTVTLTAVENYIIDTVTVTMGGVDITEEVYVNGVVTIPSVTSDVIITATAVWSPNIEYVNLLDTAVGSDGNLYGNDYNGDGVADGYLLGYELNEPATEYTITAKSGALTTGFFQITGGVPVYVKGVNIPSDANFRIVVDTDAALPGKGFWYNVAGFESYFTVEKLDDRLYKLTVTEHGAKTGTFVRFSTVSDVQGDFIITTTDLTAVPEEPEDGVVEVDIAAVGYTDDSRWSTTSGDLSSSGAPGYTAINAIYFGGATTDDSEIIVNLGGIGWNQSSTYNTFVLVDSNGVKKYANVFSSSSSAAYGIDITHNADGTTTLRLYKGTDTSMAGVAGIKVSGYGSGANAKISYKVTQGTDAS